jgi:ribosome-binding ATPase YchF (GTP1/OBG family)
MSQIGKVDEGLPLVTPLFLDKLRSALGLVHLVRCASERAKAVNLGDGLDGSEPVRALRVELEEEPFEEVLKHNR